MKITKNYINTGVFNAKRNMFCQKSKMPDYMYLKISIIHISSFSIRKMYYFNQEKVHCFKRRWEI